MKQLLEITALYLLGLNAIQIIIAAGSAVLLLKMFVDKISANRKRWRIRKRNGEIENNMWAIE